MGTYVMFKARHNLDVSTIERLAADIEAKMGHKVIIHAPFIDEALAQSLDIDVSKYAQVDSISALDSNTLLLCDELFIPRTLIEMHGDGARAILANRPDEQYIINELQEVRGGVFRYSIEYGGRYDPDRPLLWAIYSETLGGVPHFEGKWSMFDWMFEQDYDMGAEWWDDFKEDRINLYNYLRPIVSELPIYYHADQGIMEHLDYADTFAEIEQALIKNNLSLFDLTSYVESRKVAETPNIRCTVFVDDFHDIINDDN